MLASYPALRMAPMVTATQCSYCPALRPGPHDAASAAYLSELGYTTYGWGLGVNLGPTERSWSSCPSGWPISGTITASRSA